MNILTVKKMKSGSLLSDLIYSHLKNMILTLQIKSGEKLIESKIAEQFGVSRTPVREAINRLSNEGIISIYPNRAAEVTEYTKQSIQNMGIVRVVLDITSIKLAIHNGSNAEFYKLQELANNCEEAAKAGNIFLQNKLDVQFHHEISKISKNPLIIKYMSQILSQLELILNIKKTNGEQKASNSHTYHNKIIKALIERDISEAVKMTKEHLIDFYQFDESISLIL